MKSKLFAAFGIGALTATVALGAIQFASASGSSTITACANKKTGAMRYISKGKCRKTERTVRWNQQGPQGFPGATGETGPVGAGGADGVSLVVVDATGRTLGPLVSTEYGRVSFLNDGGVWTANPGRFNYPGNFVFLFRDATCTEPLGTLEYNDPLFEITSTPSDLRYVVQKSANYTPTSAYKPTGAPFRAFSLSTIYRWDNRLQTCTANAPNRVSDGEDFWLLNLTAIPLPTYVAPLVITRQ